MNKKDNRSALSRVLLFVISCSLTVGVYMYLAGLNRYVLTYGLMIGYVVACLALAFAYVIYNRGVIGKRVTPEMLKPEIPYEKRIEMANEINRRQDKSFWMIPIAFSFLLSFLLDYIGVQEIFQNIWQTF